MAVLGNETEQVRDNFGPVAPEMLIPTSIAEAMNPVPAIDSSYSTYMESQTFEDEHVYESLDVVDQVITHSQPMHQLAGTSEMAITPQEVIQDTTEDQDLHRAYDAEIRLAMRNFTDPDSGLSAEPWQDEPNTSGVQERCPVLQPLEPTEAHPIHNAEAMIEDPVEDGYIAATEVAHELGISEGTLMKILTHCKVQTSTGLISFGCVLRDVCNSGDVLDLGFGLEICPFFDLWISPELKDVLERYALHSWVFCLLDSVEPEDNGSFKTKKVISNERLESKSIQAVQTFLQEVDPLHLTLVSCCSLSCP